MKVDLSIVVPVYNTSKYLKECLDSLIDQDLEDYEIIIVNDGSTDLSEPIIDRYAARYPFIHALIKENSGLADTRNYGLRFVRGDYVAFVDSDDRVAKDAYRKLLDKAKSEDLDLVVSDFRYFYEDGIKEDFIKSGIREVTGDIHKDLILSPLFAWNKLYKTSYFKSLDIVYPKLWYEDIPVTLNAFLRTDKIGYVKEALFDYRQREGSIMASKYDKRAYDIFEILDKTLDSLKDLKAGYEEEIEYLLIEQLLVYGAFRFLRYDAPYYKELMRRAFHYMREHKGYKKSKYIDILLSKKEKIFLKTNTTLTMPIWHYYLRRHR